MRQSSVEWLALQLYQKMKMQGDGALFDNMLDKAKEMHKEEIKTTIEYYHNSMFYLQLTEKELNKITDYYYNETFEGGNNEQ